jgi:hypothetical protein
MTQFIFFMPTQLATIFEPATMLLLGTALIAAARKLRRRKK